MPLAPLGNGVDRGGLDSATMFLMGPGDF
jgi:hypothetical protein